MKYSFTNSTGGVSSGAFASRNFGLHVGDDLEAVLENRAALTREIGATQFMSQEHGNRVVVIEEVVNTNPVADALVTGIPGINLAVQVADCIPLLLASTEAVAAVHVGRKGLVNGVALHTLEIMRKMGATRISAIIGPSICGKCYEVSEEIFSEVTALHPVAAAQRSDGSFALDLPGALTEVLRKEDVDVSLESSCTVEDRELFSYRRDGVTGRQIGVISI
jgi:YfiH family protein